MKEMDVSRAYQIVLQLAERSSRYSDDELAVLDVDAREANLDLQTDIRQFVDALASTESALEGEDDQALVKSLIFLRIALMNLGSDLNNLTDSISSLFEKQAIRRMHIVRDS